MNPTPPIFPKPSLEMKQQLINRLYVKSGDMKMTATTTITAKSTSLNASDKLRNQVRSSQSEKLRSTSLIPSSSTTQNKIKDDSIDLSLIQYSHGDMMELVHLRGWEDMAQLLFTRKLEFCYLKREPLNPYELNICKVPKNLVKEDYITMSLHGIVRYYRNGEFEHRSFKEFVREFHIYHQLIKTKLFGKFHLWKPLYHWRRRIVRAKYLKSIAALKPRLFAAVPFLFSLLVFGNRICEEMRNLHILLLSKTTPYELEDTINELQQKLGIQSAKVSAYLALMIHTWKEKCENENIRILLELPSMKTENSAIIRSKGKEWQQSDISIVPLSYSERAIMRAHCRNVVRVLKVLTLLIRDSLYSLLESNLMNFNSYLDTIRHSPEHQGCLILHVTFDELTPSVDVIPPRNVVMDEYKMHMLKMLELGQYNKSLLKLKEFSQVLIPIAAELQELVTENLLDRIYGDRNNSLFRNISDISDGIDVDYSLAIETLRRYTFVCMRYEYYRQLIEALSIDTMGVMTKEVLESILHELDIDMAGCLEIPIYIKAGIVHLSLDVMRHNYHTHLVHCKSYIHDILCSLYLRQGERLYSILFAYKTTLDDEVFNLDEFIAVILKYNAATVEYPVLKDSYHFILDLRLLISVYAIESSDEMKELTGTVTTIWDSYNKSYNSFSEALAANRKFFMRELSTRSLILTPLVAACQKHLSASILNDSMADEHEALIEIQLAADLMKNILSICERVVQYQDIMKVNVFDYDTILDYNEEIKSITTLWTVVEEVKIVRRDLFAQQWRAVDPEVIGHHCRGFNRLMRGVSRPEVIPDLQKWLSSTIFQVMETSRLISLLQSRTLKKYHCQEIELKMRMPVFSNDELLVKDLVTGLAYINEVVGVHSVSTYESNLEKKYVQLHSQCSVLQADVVSDKWKVMWSIANFPALLEIMMDIECNIKLCTESKHSTPCIDKLQELLSHVIVWQKKISALKFLQDEFLKVRALFTSPRAAKSFHKTLKYFKVLDDFWRTIYTSCKENMPFIEVLNQSDLDENIKEVESNLSIINTRIDDFCTLQCEAWPILYILDKKSILDLFSIVDIDIIYGKYRDLLLPFSTSFVNHGIERDRTVGIMSFQEKVLLPITVYIASKGDIVEWFRGITEGLREKLLADIQTFMDGKETISTDLRNPRCMDQSRTFVVDCNFWSELTNYSVLKPDKKMLMKLKLKHNSTMGTYSTLISSFITPYQRVCAANVIMSMINHRDIIADLSDANNKNSLFTFESCIKVSWDKALKKGIISQSYISFDYGASYQGFGQRIFLTPLTQRVLFNLTLTLQGSTVPVLAGPHENNKSSLLSEYAHFGGFNKMVIDSEVFRSQLIIDRVLYAALKADAFLIIKNAELITAKFASVLVEKLAMIQKLRETPDATIVLGANSISANRLQSRVCLLVHESSSVVDSDWTYKHRLVFRPIHVEKLPRNILFQSLLLSVGYMDYIAMAARFDCVVVYILSTYESFKEESVMKVLIDSIRVVGLDASLVSKYRKATLEVIKCFVSKLALLDRRIDVFDVICRCCLYMKTNVHGDNENGEDLTLDAPKADISRYEMLLTTVKETNSVIVTGPCGCGKTTSIKNVFQDLYSAVAQSDDFVYQSTSFRTVVLTEVIGITMKAASTDPITVMTEMEDYITDLVAQLPESRKSLHVVHVDTSYLAYTSLLTRWCSLTFQARRPDVKFLWEVGDTHGFEPSVLQDVPIVTLEMQEYGVSEILGFHIELTAEKVREHFTFEHSDIVKAITTNVQSLLHPLLEMLPHQPSFVQLSTVISNVLKIATGLMLKFKSSATSTIDVFELDFKKCLVFAITWAMGDACFPSRVDFMYAILQIAGDEAAVGSSVFPPFDHMFESTLSHPAAQDEDSQGGLVWLKVDTEIPQPVRRPIRHCVSFFGFEYELIIPTALGLVLDTLQTALKHDGQIVLHGPSWGGKSALIAQLLQSPVHESRALCYLKNKDSMQARQRVIESQGLIKGAMFERGCDVYASSIFIEDICFDMTSPQQLSNGCADFLRHLFSSKSFYNLKAKQTQHLDEVFTLMTTRALPKVGSQRLSRFALFVAVETDSRHVMRCLIREVLPCVDSASAADMTSFTHDIIAAYSADVMPIALQIKPLAVISRMIPKISEVLECIDNPSTNDAIKAFARILFETVFPKTVTDLKDKGVKILREKSTTYKDHVFPGTMYTGMSKFDVDLARNVDAVLSITCTKAEFRDYCLSKPAFSKAIPSYINTSSQLFWMDVKRLIGSIQCGQDLLILIGGQNYLLCDLTELVSSYLQHTYIPVVINTHDNCVEKLSTILTTSFTAYIESNSRRAAVHNTTILLYLSFDPTIEMWQSILDVIMFREASMLLKHRLGAIETRIQMRGNLRSSIKDFLSHVKFVLTFGANIDAEVAIKGLVCDVPAQLKVATHCIAKNSSYVLDMTKLEQSFGADVVEKAFGVVDEIISRFQSKAASEVGFTDQLFTASYLHESLRLILHVLVLCSTDLDAVRRSITEQYSKAGSSLEENHIASRSELALTDAIQLVLYVRYFLHCGKEDVIQSKQVILRALLEERGLTMTSVFEPVCVLLGIAVAHKRTSVCMKMACTLAAFLPSRSVLSGLVLTCAFAILTDRSALVVDHSGLATVLLAKVLSVQLKTVFDMILNQKVQLIADFSSNNSELLTQTALRILAPTIELHSLMTSEVLAVFMLFKGLEDTTEIIESWKSSNNYSSYSAPDFRFKWRRHTRTLEKSTLMLCSMLTSTAEINASVTESIKDVMLAPFHSESAMPMKSLYLYLCISESLSHLKDNLSKNEYMLWTLYVTLQLSSDSSTDPISFINKFLTMMYTSNGKVGYQQTTLSPYTLMDSSNEVFGFVESSLVESMRGPIKKTIELQTEDAIDFLQSLSITCADMPFTFENRAFTWEEVLAVSFVIKPHILPSVVTAIVEDKGVPISTLSFLDGFKENIIATVTSMLDSHRAYPINADEYYHKAIKVVRFHFLLFHAIMKVYFNRPCLVDTIFDETLYFLLDIIDNCCSKMRSEEFIYFMKQYVIDAVYKVSLSKVLQKEFLLSCFETFFNSMQFDPKTGQVLKGFFGAIEPSIALSRLDTYLLKMFNKCIHTEQFLLEQMGLRVYDLNTSVRLELHRALEVRVLPAPQLSTAYDLSVLLAKISALRAEIPSPFDLTVEYKDLFGRSDDGTTASSSGSSSRMPGTLRTASTATGGDVGSSSSSSLMNYVEFEAENFNLRRSKVLSYLTTLLSDMSKNNIENIYRDLASIENDIVPALMPPFNDIPEYFRRDLSLTAFIAEMKRKFGLINKWKNDGRPGVLNFKYFQNPFLLVMALREHLAVKRGVPLESTVLTYSLMSKMTPAIMKNIQEDKEVTSIYFYGLHLVHAQYDESKNVLTSLPTYMNSIMGSQKLFLKVSVCLQDTKPADSKLSDCPIYIGDEIPPHFSVLHHPPAAKAVLTIRLPFDEELLHQRGRGVALINLTT